MATGKVHPPKKAYQQLKSVATSKLDQLKKNLQLQLKSVKFHNTTETERCLNRSEELCLGLLMDLLIQLFSPLGYYPCTCAFLLCAPGWGEALQVSCIRTQSSAPYQGSILDCSIWSWCIAVLPPALNLPVPIYAPGWGEALQVSCVRTQFSAPYQGLILDCWISS